MKIFKRKPQTKETREKISKALLGNQNGRLSKGILKSEEHKRKISEALKGRKHSEETKKKMSRSCKKGWQSGLRKGGWKLSEEIKEKMSRVHRGKYIGKDNPNWKGGITSENNRIRNSREFRLWRKAVLERDNFTCQKYGTQGGVLHVHHINNFAEFSELRVAIDNGIILSEKAHKEFHKRYGKENNTREQLKEFLNTGLTK